jgi:protein-tyrosine phosphatase
MPGYYMKFLLVCDASIAQTRLIDKVRTACQEAGHAAILYGPATALDAVFDLELLIGIGHYSGGYETTPSFIAGAKIDRVRADIPLAALIVGQADDVAAGAGFIAMEHLDERSVESSAMIGAFIDKCSALVRAEQRRIAPLQGGHNFRDIGGYQSQNGQRVRWGRVFRSGTMAMLTEADQQYMAQLGIKVICDFRSSKERAIRPTQWSESHRIVQWSRDHESSVGEIVASLSHPAASAASMREKMLAAYRDLPYEQADSYREVFRRIADGDMPLIFHCSAGKDRTGIAAALLLTLLGVPHQQVVADYLLTERFFERGCRMVLSEPTSRRFAKVDPAIWEPMMRAEPAYIEAMFDTLRARHGRVEAYLEHTLGLDASLRTRIQRELLE